MPTATYIALAEFTTSGNTQSVTFSSIPATYRDLVLVINGKTTSGPVAIEVFVNNSSSGYSLVQMTGDGSSTSSNSQTNPEIIMSSTDGMNIINFMDYSATDKHKTMLVRDNIPGNRVRASAIRWDSTNAITTIRIGDNPFSVNIASGTTFGLYGIVS